MNRVRLYAEKIKWEVANPISFYFPIPPEVLLQIVTSISVDDEVRVFSIAPLGSSPMVMVCGEYGVKETLYDLVDGDTDLYYIRFGWCHPFDLDSLPEHTGW
jgi:hypothetical protein